MSIITFTSPGIVPTTDTTPDAFSFTDVSNAQLTTSYSDSFTLSGLPVGRIVPYTLSSNGQGTSYITIEGGPNISPPATGFIKQGDVVEATILTGSAYGTEHTLTLNINGVQDTFTSTTEAQQGGWQRLYTFDGPVGANANNHPNGFGGNPSTGDTIFTNEVTPVAGTTCGKNMIPAQDSSGGFGKWGGGWVFPTTLREGDQIWWRAFIRWPSGFNMNMGGAPLCKHFRIYTRHAAGGNIFNNGVTFGYEGIDRRIAEPRVAPGNWPEEGPLLYDPDIVPDTWEHWEQYVKLHSDPAQAKIRCWRNNTLVWESFNSKTLAVSTAISPFCYFLTYWNGEPVYPQTPQYCYIDQVKIQSSTPSATDSNGYPFIGDEGLV
jgi:hypothetical protein